jgi:hypothetical protein
MKTQNVDLLKAFIDAGELEYAYKVVELSKGTIVPKVKSKRKNPISKSEVKRLKLKKLIHSVAKPFDSTIPTLQVAGDVFGVKLSSYLYSRTVASIEMLAESGSVYLNPKNQIDGWYVDTSIVDVDFINSMKVAA